MLGFLNCCCLCVDKSRLFPSHHGGGCAGTGQVGGCRGAVLGAVLTGRLKQRIQQVSRFQ